MSSKIVTTIVDVITIILIIVLSILTILVEIGRSTAKGIDQFLTRHRGKNMGAIPKRRLRD